MEKQVAFLSCEISKNQYLGTVAYREYDKTTPHAYCFSIVFFYFTLHRPQRKDWHPRNPCEHLAVLAPAHVEGALTEDLTLHVDTVLADEAHATLAAGHSALAGALAVVLGVGSVELVGDASLSHFCKLFTKSVE